MILIGIGKLVIFPLPLYGIIFLQNQREYYKRLSERLENIKFCIYCTVRKMGLILRSIEWMIKMQFSIAHKFTPLHIYNAKPPKKPHKHNLPVDMPCFEKLD